MDDEPSDVELVARLAATRPAASQETVSRDPDEALHALFDRHSGAVAAMARRMLGSREEAEEVVQDAFLKLYQHAHEFTPRKASVRTYLFAIARNLTLSRLRRRRARPRVLNEIDPHDTAFQSAVGQPDDPLPGILVRGVLARLADGERELLEAAFYGGYSHAELAQRYDLPLGTVKARIRRALLKLREMLEKGVP